MERWNLVNKLIVLLLIIAVSYFGEVQPSPWMVLSLLAYIAVMLLAQLVHPPRLKLVLNAFAGYVLLLCMHSVNPVFILLLPLILRDILNGYLRSPYVLLSVMALPLLFLSELQLQLGYAFITAFFAFNGTYADLLQGKIRRQEEQLDKLRGTQERLMNRLHENEDFIRAAEYTYKLEERNRLSQELHDGVGHAMTGALIQMEAAKALLWKDEQAAEKLLQNAIGISQEAIEQIRLTLKNTKPPTQQLGIHRLKAVVEAFGSSSGLLTTVVHEGEIERISPLHWKVIHDNAAEALTNTAKYAGATAVHVEVRVLGKLVKAVVSDNGRGQAKIVKGLGLVGMEERAAAVNGTVIADGASGFSVTTLLPLSEMS